MVEISNYLPCYTIEDLLDKSVSWLNVVYIRILKAKYGDKVVIEAEEIPIENQKIDVRELEKIPGLKWRKKGPSRKKTNG